jgi:hypothetical protein
MRLLTKDALIGRVDGVLQKHSQMRRGGGDWIEHGSAGLFRSAGLSLLLDIYGTDHHHYADFLQLTSRHEIDEYEQAKSIILIAKEEILSGWLERTTGLIAAGVFSDFLEMAQHLWDEGYKDAAAVIAGSSLEAHLKRMSEGHGIDLEFKNSKGDLVPKKADSLNSELAKAQAYDKTEQKQVTAWLGVRNDAAHGDYGKVISEVVGAMIHGIRMFIGRHPA